MLKIAGKGNISIVLFQKCGHLDQKENYEKINFTKETKIP